MWDLDACVPLYEYITVPFYSLDSGHASCQDAEDHPADSHLPSKPGDYSFPLSIVCTDGSIHGDFTILVHYSEQVEELVRPLYRDCSSCHRSICLPDFTIMTAARMMQLLTTGEDVEYLNEEKNQELTVKLKYKNWQKNYKEFWHK